MIKYSSLGVYNSEKKKGGRKMKSRDVAKILKSKMPIEEKKRILDHELSRPSTGKVLAGVAVAALVATGVTKLVSDKIKERKMIKELEEQEEAEFWDAYYENYDIAPEDLEVENEFAFNETLPPERDFEREFEQEH